jgi:pyrroloquinoline quinone biosynthesis protein D
VIASGSRPRLRRGVRLGYDKVRDRHVMMFPEGVLVLNETAADIVARCDGAATVTEITDALAAAYLGVRYTEVVDVLTRLADRRMIEVADDAG